MTAPDIVTEARQMLAEITPRPWQQAGRGVEGERRRVLLADCMRWNDAAFIAAAPRLVTDLTAEVERLRHELDQRTDPELAAALLNCGVENRGGRNFAIVPIGEAMRAARLLGGDQ